MSAKVRFLPATRKHRMAMKAVNEQVLTENYSLAFWESIIAQHRSQVVLVGGEVVGYCLCTDNGDVVSLAVLPAHQRQGYGRKLLQQTLNLAQPYRLHCRVSNTAARTLYQSLGFFAIKTLESYYRDGETAFLMVRPVS